MLPWIRLDETTAPDGDVLRLFRRGEEFSIRLGDGNELMNSRLGGSEEALATLAIDALDDRTAPRILIGGLGMGFTLRAAQPILGSDACIDVAEIVPRLIDWARGPLAPVFGNSLDDARVTLLSRDVSEILREPGVPYDAVLLDVDNGPDGLTRPGNDRLYDAGGLARAWAALRPGGILAIWSAHPDRGFERRLADAGYDIRTEMVRARAGKRGPRHVIWIARRPS
ncbi:spermidine synthase [Palleronia sp. LCG004]|uniref:spermidine synthase n=1 Tax=Palleronia sp. LCG004 TaxID=3079304 RepID=UPI002943445B|nr:spermidine synthase [Palleronia sp. LCG004]WOI57402.1 spermidine synthase [Palleronia sp. LCG004]